MIKILTKVFLATICFLLLASSGYAQEQKTLKVVLSLDREDKIAAQIRELLKNIEENSYTLRFNIHYSARGSEAFSMLANDEADISWAYHPLTAGRLTWLNMFSLPGLTGVTENLSIDAWRLSKNVFAEEFEFRKIKVLSLVIFPSSRLYTNQKISNLTQAQTLKIRCTSDNCYNTAKLLGATAVTAIDDEVSELIEKGEINAIFFPANVGHLYVKKNIEWKKLLPIRIIESSEWERPSASLIMSKASWDSLTEQQQNLFASFGEEAMVRNITKILVNQQAIDDELHSSNKIGAEIAFSDAEQRAINNGITNWRKSAIRQSVNNNQKLSAVEALLSAPPYQ